ncbi:hypothetical protein [Actinoplanes sp. NPDC049802]|uniref:hypothetical protein n=1 Tax=Actinoplanes sp. NPDC049802 TaxID=3154742 RepID=UPI0033F5B942
MREAFDTPYREYRHTGRPLLDGGNLDENGDPLPSATAVQLIAAAVKAVNYRELQSIFKKKRDRTEFYLCYTRIVAEDDRFQHLRALLETYGPNCRDVILLIGAAGVDYRQAAVLAKHQGLNYAAIAHLIKRARKGQLVAATGRAGS